MRWGVREYCTRNTVGRKGERGNLGNIDIECSQGVTMREMRRGITGVEKAQGHMAEDRWVETFLNKIAEANMGWCERLECV